MDAGAVGSMRKLGITESYKLKRQVVVSASEAAEMIIRYVRNPRRSLTCSHRFQSRQHLAFDTEKTGGAIDGMRFVVSTITEIHRFSACRIFLNWVAGLQDDY